MMQGGYHHLFGVVVILAIEIERTKISFSVVFFFLRHISISCGVRKDDVFNMVRPFGVVSFFTSHHIKKLRNKSHEVCTGKGHLRTQCSANMEQIITSCNEVDSVLLPPGCMNYFTGNTRIGDEIAIIEWQPHSKEILNFYAEVSISMWVVFATRDGFISYI